MRTGIKCHECHRIAARCRQIRRFELGEDWRILIAMSEHILESVNKAWKGRYICPECYDFELTARHSTITFEPPPHQQFKGRR
jgi:hypothetical protein